MNKIKCVPPLNRQGNSVFFNVAEYPTDVVYRAQIITGF
jgi:hypothetical protein